MKAIDKLQKNKMEEVVKIHDNLRKKIKFWNGGHEIRKWRERRIIR